MSAALELASAIRRYALRRLLKAIPTEKPVVALKRKGAIFTKSLFVAEVRYRG